jgi:hypothetical protein
MKSVDEASYFVAIGVSVGIEAADVLQIAISRVIVRLRCGCGELCTLGARRSSVRASGPWSLPRMRLLEVNDCGVNTMTWFYVDNSKKNLAR